MTHGSESCVVERIVASTTVVRVHYPLEEARRPHKFTTRIQTRGGGTKEEKWGGKGALVGSFGVERDIRR